MTWSTGRVAEAIAQVMCLLTVTAIVAVLLATPLASERREGFRSRRLCSVRNVLLAMFGAALLAPAWHSSDSFATAFGVIGGIVGTSFGPKRLAWVLLYGLLGSVIGAWVGVWASLARPYHSAYAALSLPEWSACAVIQGLLLGLGVSGGVWVGSRIRSSFPRNPGTKARDPLGIAKGDH